MRGITIPLSRPRRLMCDLMHFSAGVPTVPVQRLMNLGPVAEARRLASHRLPWTAIFAKAFALVAGDIPVFRRAYCKCPWPHFYEYPVSVATITVERDYGDEKAVFGVRVKDPAALPLSDIGAAIRYGMTAPIEEVKSFRRSLRVAGLPRAFRRMLWWVGLNVGRQRANHFGTFAISVYSALGAESLHPLSPLTCTLNYGVFASDDSVNVRCIYDHRVTDGATVARGLAQLETVLNTVIRDELLASRNSQRAA